MNDHTPAVASYAASGTTTLWGLMTFQHWVALGGLLLGVATFCVNTYYARRRAADAAQLAELDRQIKEAQLEALRRE